MPSKFKRETFRKGPIRSHMGRWLNNIRNYLKGIGVSMRKLIDSAADIDFWETSAWRPSDRGCVTLIYFCVKRTNFDL